MRLDHQWRAGIFGFLLAIAYLPGISAPSLTLRWCLLWIGPWLLLREAPAFDSRRAMPLALFVAWATLTTLWAPNAHDAIGALLVLFAASGMFLLGAVTDECESLYLGVGCGLVIAAITGLFQDPNHLGWAAAVAGIAAARMRAYSLAVALAVVVLLSGSRGAFLGLGCVAVAALIASGRYRFAAVAALASALLVSALAFLITKHGTHAGVIARLDIWRDGLSQVSIFGHGLGSFWSLFPQGASHYDILAVDGDRPDHAYSDGLEIAIEAGIVGLALALLALCSALRNKVTGVDGLALLTVIGCGLTGFPLYVPVTLAMAAFALGRLCRRADDRAAARRGGIFRHAGAR